MLTPAGCRRSPAVGWDAVMCFMVADKSLLKRWDVHKVPWFTPIISLKRWNVLNLVLESSLVLNFKLLAPVEYWKHVVSAAELWTGSIYHTHAMGLLLGDLLLIFDGPYLSYWIANYLKMKLCWINNSNGPSRLRSRLDFVFFSFRLGLS